MPSAGACSDAPRLGPFRTLLRSGLRERVQAPRSTRPLRGVERTWRRIAERQDSRPKRPHRRGLQMNEAPAGSDRVANEHRGDASRRSQDETARKIRKERDRQLQRNPDGKCRFRHRAPRKRSFVDQPLEVLLQAEDRRAESGEHPKRRRKSAGYPAHQRPHLAGECEHDRHHAERNPEREIDHVPVTGRRQHLAPLRAARNNQPIREPMGGLRTHQRQRCGQRPGKNIPTHRQIVDDPKAASAQAIPGVRPTDPCLAPRSEP